MNSIGLTRLELMKKAFFYLNLKIVLSIILFNVCTFGYANPENKFETQYKVEIHDIINKSTNDLPFALVESKIGVTIVLISDGKKTSNIQAYKANPYFENNPKTTKLCFNFIHPIIPSLGNTTLIFPFHSFY